ncbi:hypothetical protein DPMN_094360 [Dreissena polymorpha]|uniref:Uncharacterized protein n=1 Tax=Dreissena polymorpha TaxID=45954 RepID=A0A9D4L4Z7_DREPO|nr:hypothetical protein DPMN_094360 [Dreissena polymorpha]
MRISEADHYIKHVLPDILKNYEEDDIYNANKTGIYYRALLDGTLVSKEEAVAGSKKKGPDNCHGRLQHDGYEQTAATHHQKKPTTMLPPGEKSLPVVYDSN